MVSSSSLVINKRKLVWYSEKISLGDGISLLGDNIPDPEMLCSRAAARPAGGGRRDGQQPAALDTRLLSTEE